MHLEEDECQKREEVITAHSGMTEVYRVLCGRRGMRGRRRKGEGGRGRQRKGEEGEGGRGRREGEGGRGRERE